jgi:hypothetical protein
MAIAAGARLTIADSSAVLKKPNTGTSQALNKTAACPLSGCRAVIGSAAERPDSGTQANQDCYTTAIKL